MAHAAQHTLLRAAFSWINAWIVRYFTEGATRNNLFTPSRLGRLDKTEGGGG